MAEKIRTKAETLAIASRRFGSRHKKPCAFPTVVTCAAWKCQEANRCQHLPAAPRALDEATHDR